LLALAGCYEGVGGAQRDSDLGDSASGSEGSGSASESGDEDPSAVDCDAPQPGPTPIRRLSRRELDNTLRDLLGPDAALASSMLPPDVQPRIFDTDVGSHGITEELAYAYMHLAEAVAEQATSDVQALVGCDPADGQSCARSFAEDLCPRAWRRPCDADEIDALVDVWSTADDFTDGTQRMLAVTLQSADFLYRPEIGDASAEQDGVVPLDSWEMASRLSYFLWGSMPDEALFAAADEDALRDADAIAAQVDRMLADPRAEAQTVWFHEQWLGLTAIEDVAKDPVLFPGFDTARVAMREEAARFVVSIVLDGGSLRDLLTSRTTFLDDELAAFYGVPAPGSDELTRVELPADRHAGILTKGAFLSIGGNQASSSPVRRGVTVLRQVMCGEPPPPPPDVDGSVPAPTPDTTTRERFEAHVSDPSCAACHNMFDPIGFAFEHFDAAGRWRDEDNGFPVDASGDLVGTDVDGPFDGAVELAAKLADSERVHACYVDHLFAFAAGRPSDEDADACTIDSLEHDFAASGGTLTDLLVAYARSDAFRHRRRDP
jgi:hypothetical protein